MRSCAQGDSEQARAAAVESLAVGLVSAVSGRGSHACVQDLAGARRPDIPNSSLMRRRSPCMACCKIAWRHQSLSPAHRKPSCPACCEQPAPIGAGGLLDRLLYSFPGLKWSPTLLTALCTSLSNGADADDALPGNGRSAAQSANLQRLKWVSDICNRIRNVSRCSLQSKDCMPRT